MTSTSRVTTGVNLYKNEWEADVICRHAIRRAVILSSPTGLYRSGSTLYDPKFGRTIQPNTATPPAEIRTIGNDGGQRLKFASWLGPGHRIPVNWVATAHFEPSMVRNNGVLGGLGDAMALACFNGISSGSWSQTGFGGVAVWVDWVKLRSAAWSFAGTAVGLRRWADHVELAAPLIAETRTAAQAFRITARCFGVETSGRRGWLLRPLEVEAPPARPARRRGGARHLRWMGRVGIGLNRKSRECAVLSWFQRE